MKAPLPDGAGKTAKRAGISEAAVLTAGIFWGSMGIFTRHLGAAGIDSAGAIVLRCTLAGVFFLLLLAVRSPAALRVHLRDVWCFIGSGLASMLFFTYCYFQAIAAMSLSTAAILLYTAPAFVMLLSAPLFGERITPLKLCALAMALCGCVLVSGIGSESAVTLQGLLYGLGAGIGYALYSIFARFALNRGYQSLTINCWSCLLAGIGAAVIWGVREPVAVMLASPSNLLWCLGTAVVTCFLPYALYTWGLSGMENGKASVLASVEPAVATLLGAAVFGEMLTPLSLLGVCLVLAAIILLNLKPRLPHGGHS